MGEGRCKSSFYPLPPLIPHRYNNKFAPAFWTSHMGGREADGPGVGVPFVVCLNGRRKTHRIANKRIYYSVYYYKLDNTNKKDDDDQQK